MQIANVIHSSGRAVVYTGHQELAEHYWEQLKAAGLTMAPLCLDKEPANFSTRQLAWMKMKFDQGPRFVSTGGQDRFLAGARPP